MDPNSDTLTPKKPDTGVHKRGDLQRRPKKKKGERGTATVLYRVEKTSADTAGDSRRGTGNRCASQNLKKSAILALRPRQALDRTAGR